MQSLEVEQEVAEGDQVREEQRPLFLLDQLLVVFLQDCILALLVNVERQLVVVAFLLDFHLSQALDRHSPLLLLKFGITCFFFTKSTVYIEDPLGGEHNEAPLRHVVPVLLDNESVELVVVLDARHLLRVAGHQVKRLLEELLPVERQLSLDDVEDRELLGVVTNLITKSA